MLLALAVVHRAEVLGTVDCSTSSSILWILEPYPCPLVCSKVPVSFHYKQRVQMAYDAAQRVQSEERSVDTSDLEVKEEDWHQDEADSTLLGYAELEVMGHKVRIRLIEFNLERKWYVLQPFTEL